MGLSASEYKRIRHEAAIKSWKTRRRNQAGGGSDAVKSAGDWKAKPRWRQRGSRWPMETTTRDFFAKTLGKLPQPVQEIANKFLRNVAWDDHDMYRRAGYYPFTGGIVIGNLGSEADVVHEVGHAIDQALTSKDYVHPSMSWSASVGLHEKGPSHWSSSREFTRAFNADVRDLRKSKALADWEYTASKKTEGFAAAFADIMGFPKEDAQGNAKPGYRRAFPRTRKAVYEKLKEEGLLK